MTYIICMHAQDEMKSFRLNLVKHPVTKRYGYAFKEQNVRSPIHGAGATAVNIVGSGGSFLISKEDADYIDWAVPAQYDDAASKFKENVAMVKVNGKVGFIDLYNRFVIAPVYDGDTDIDGFHEGLAAVKKNGMWGYINKLGKQVIAFQYEEADNFCEEMIAAVKKGGRWGAIDINGEVVVPFNYKNKAMMVTMPTNNKAYRKAKKNGKEKKENGSFEKRLSELRNATKTLNENIAKNSPETLIYNKIGAGDSIGMADQYGRHIVPMGYESVDYNKANSCFIVKKCGRYGLYTYNGGRIVAPCFETMTAGSNGRFNVCIEGINGWIDNSGHINESLLPDLCNSGSSKTNKTEKRRIYEAVLDINPEYASAYNNIALLDIEAKDYNKGMRKLKLAHELEPENETIKKNLDWAKNSRKERRSERWNTGLSIATAVITLGMTAYSTYSSFSGNTTMTPSGGYSSGSDYSSGKSTSTGSSSNSGGVGPNKCMTCMGNGNCTGKNKSYCHGSGLCGYCHGTGWLAAGADKAICKACNGTSKCKTCHGTGKCMKCGGTGKK